MWTYAIRIPSQQLNSLFTSSLLFLKFRLSHTVQLDPYSLWRLKRKQSYYPYRAHRLWLSMGCSKRDTYRVRTYWNDKYWCVVLRCINPREVLAYAYVGCTPRCRNLHLRVRKDNLLRCNALSSRNSGKWLRTTEGQSCPRPVSTCILQLCLNWM